MMLAVVGLVAIAVGVSGADPQPTPWPYNFYAIESKNGSSMKGERGPFQATEKYYNWDKQALRQTCSTGDITSTFLMVGTDGWVFNVLNKACSYLKMPVTPVKPDWMVGGSYVGTQVRHGAPSQCWNKMDHIYCQSTYTGQPTYVFTPLDQKGFKNDESYLVFIEGGATDSAFVPPDFCTNKSAPTPAGQDCPKADPKCCFLPIFVPPHGQPPPMIL